MNKHKTKTVEKDLGNYHNIFKTINSSTYSFNDWFTQFKNRIKNFQKINHILNLTLEEQRGCLHSKFKFAVTPYILSLMDKNSENCPIRRQFIPTINEIKVLPEELTQKEEQNSEYPYGVINKHSNSITIFLTDQCASYCRFCSWRNFVGKTETYLNHGEFGLVIKYIKEHPEITNVILSGGDPLTLSDEKLDFYLSQLRKIQTISVIQIETRVPILLPHRITQKLCDVLKKYKPIFINVMFNHPKEINEFTVYACSLLINNGLVINSNTVLLRGINDKLQILAELFNKLLSLNIRPYQLLQCDISEGISHFRTPLSVGLKLIKQLRGLTSDLAIPNFVVNLTSINKIVVSPQVIVSKNKNNVILKDYEDKIFVYPEVKY
mgnify:CR=1 FL=1